MTKERVVVLWKVVARAKVFKSVFGLVTTLHTKAALSFVIPSEAEGSAVSADSSWICFRQNVAKGEICGFFSRALSLGSNQLLRPRGKERIHRSEHRFAALRFINTLAQYRPARHTMGKPRGKLLHPAADGSGLLRLLH
jgi:hypothetical protein